MKADAESLDTRAPGMSQSAFLSVALFLIFIWGTAYTLVGVGVRHLEPIWLVAGRTVVASVLMVGVIAATGRRLPALSDKRWIWYAVLGQTGVTLPFYLLSEGQTRVDSGLTAIIVGSMPILTVILAHFFAGERLTWRKSLGFVIGFAGIVLLFLPDDFSLSLVAEWRHQVLLLGAALLYAVTTVSAKNAPETDSLVGATIMVLSAAVSAWIWALSTGVPGESLAGGPIPSYIWWVVLGLGVGSTGFGTIFYLLVVDRTGPSAMAKINYFPPVVSVAAGVALLGEAFTWKIVVAFAVIMVGVAVSRGERTI
jgi:drug/metabolite transporter (DMT)-like permease